MTDLHELRGQSAAQMDKVGWTFAAVVIVITALGGIVAYHGSQSAPAPLAHAIASR